MRALLRWLLGEPQTDWTTAGGFPLLRYLSGAERARAGREPRWRGFIRRLRARRAEQAAPLAAADLARRAAVTCSSCATLYLPRATGSKPPEDGRCRRCATALAEHAVVSIAGRARSRR